MSLSLRLDSKPRIGMGASHYEKGLCVVASVCVCSFKIIYSKYRDF